MWDSTAVHRSLSTATGLDVDGHLHLAHSGAEVRGIPHLPKPGRYGAPVIRYGPGREKYGANIEVAKPGTSSGVALAAEGVALCVLLAAAEKALRSEPVTF